MVMTMPYCLQGCYSINIPYSIVIAVQIKTNNITAQYPDHRANAVFLSAA